MKRVILVFALLFIALVAFSQTWTVDGGEDWDIEYTVISMDAFGRIMKANETTAEGVSLVYFDASQLGRETIIKGTRPELKGYYFIAARLIAKSPSARSAVSHLKSRVYYGNSETGEIQITFYDTDFMFGVISLKVHWNEYIKQLNSLLDLVNGE